jgi:hypothetical protein
MPARAWLRFVRARIRERMLEAVRAGQQRLHEQQQDGKRRAQPVGRRNHRGGR